MYSLLLNEKQQILHACQGYFIGDDYISVLTLGEEEISKGYSIVSIDESLLNNLEKSISLYKYVNGELILDLELVELNEKIKIQRLRNEAFAIGDKYQNILLYNSLTSEQQTQLAEWRQAWLDATETKILPELLAWMK